MNTRTYLAIFLIASSIAVGIASVALPVSAEDPARGGLDKADENVHDTPGGLLGDIDKRFHEGICQGGHSTTIVDRELGGCDAIKEPGGKNP